MARLKVNLPNQPRGAEIEIPGLGLFKNGSTREVDEDQVEAWRWYNQRAVEVGDRSHDGVAAVEYQRGPTLKQYFENHDHIEVLDDEPQERSKSKRTEDTAPVGSDTADAGTAAEQEKKFS